MEATEMIAAIVVLLIYVNIFAIYGFITFLSIRMMLVVPSYLRKISETLKKIESQQK